MADLNHQMLTRRERRLITAFRNASSAARLRFESIFHDWDTPMPESKDQRVEGSSLEFKGNVMKKEPELSRGCNLNRID